MNKKVLAIIGIISLFVIAAGGSFYSGMLFQRSQTANVRNNFFAGRGGNGGAGGGGAGGGGAGGGGGFFGGGGGAGGGGAVGQIKSINGNTITLSTAQSEVTVTLTDTTQILKTVTGATSDLKAGDRIAVRGQRDSAGNVTADMVQITVNPTGQGQ